MFEVGEIRTEKELGRKGSHKFIWHACLDCGKGRWTQLIKGQPETLRCFLCNNKRFGEQGRERSGEKSLAWRGGKVKRVCLNCGQEFKICPSRIKYSGGKFCSYSCSIIYYRKHGAFNQYPNKPEKTLIKLIQDNNLPFRYVGSGEVWLGNKNPDFINVNGKKQVIEYFGVYWHPLFDGAERTEHYKQYGFSALIIWENELEDEPKLLDKIKTFTRRRLE